MNEFINSRSMLTPGVAGALVMVLANSLSSAFKMSLSLSVLVLILSFLLGVIVLGDDKIKWFFRLPLYILNSLIIFSMAYGSNSLGKRVENASANELQPSEEIKSEIKPISLNEHHRTFLFAQHVFVDTAITSSKIRKEAVKRQIVTLSNSLLLLQHNIVSNQKEYNDPRRKMDVLVQINNVLVSINKAIEKDGSITSQEFDAYQKSLDNAQHNAGVLQNALLLEKSKSSKQKVFFKDWN